MLIPLTVDAWIIFAKFRGGGGYLLQAAGQDVEYVYGGTVVVKEDQYPPKNLHKGEDGKDYGEEYKYNFKRVWWEEEEIGGSWVD